MKYIKTSLTLKPATVERCKKIAFEADMSFSRFLHVLMERAVKSDARRRQRTRARRPARTTRGANPKNTKR